MLVMEAASAQREVGHMEVSPELRMIPLVGGNINIIAPPHVVNSDSGSTYHVLAHKEVDGKKIPICTVWTMPWERRRSDGGPDQYGTDVAAEIGVDRTTIYEKRIGAPAMSARREALTRGVRVRWAQKHAARVALTHIGVSRREARKIARQMSPDVLS